MKSKLSNYTIGVLGFNLLALLFISFYLFKIWHFRVSAHVNLIFFKEMFITFATLPLYYIWIKQLNNTKQNDKTFNKGLITILLFLFFVIYGSGMHNASNQIRSVINEPIVYFYDEILSHFIFLTALFGVGISLALLQFNSPNKNGLTQKEKIIILFSGIFQGLIIVLGSLEANFGFWALIFSAVFFIILIIKTRKTLPQQYPLTWYYLFHYGTILIFLLLFICINKSFREPLVFSIENLK